VRYLNLPIENLKRAALEKKPLVLKPWDPMGSLA
jgi:aminopeptidase C